MLFELQPILITTKTQTLVVNAEIFYVTDLFEKALHLATLGNIIEQQLIV